MTLALAKVTKRKRSTGRENRGAVAAAAEAAAAAETAAGEAAAGLVKGAEADHQGLTTG